MDIFVLQYANIRHLTSDFHYVSLTSLPPYDFMYFFFLFFKSKNHSRLYLVENLIAESTLKYYFYNITLQTDSFECVFNIFSNIYNIFCLYLHSQWWCVYVYVCMFVKNWFINFPGIFSVHLCILFFLQLYVQYTVNSFHLFTKSFRVTNISELIHLWLAMVERRK